MYFTKSAVLTLLYAIQATIAAPTPVDNVLAPRPSTCGPASGDFPFVAVWPGLSAADPHADIEVFVTPDNSLIDDDDPTFEDQIPTKKRDLLARQAGVTNARI